MASNISKNLDAALTAAEHKMEEDAFAIPENTNENNTDASGETTAVINSSEKESLAVKTSNHGKMVDKKPRNQKKKDPINEFSEESLNEAFGVSEVKEAIPIKKEEPKKKRTSGMVITSDDDITEDALNEIKDAIVAEPVSQDPFAPAASPAGRRAALPELKMEDVYEVIPDIQGKDREDIASTLFNEISEYRKNAMVNYGMTPEEADHAAATRLVSRGKQYNEQYVEKHPVGVVTIDKTAETEFKSSLTDEEREKLQDTRAIRLVIVEDQKLRSLKTKKLPPRVEKASFLRTIDAAISSYRVPLPIMGDYAQFSGAQSLQMALAFNTAEEDTIIDVTTRQAELVYDRFYASSSIRKYDDSGKVLVTYDEFINTVPYFDLALMLYAVYVASTPELQELTMSCGRCKKEFKFKMNTKTLIQVKELPQKTQDQMNDILKHTQSTEYLQKKSEEWKTETLFESPFTGNIYQLQQPTIAKVIDICQKCDLENAQDASVILFGMCMNGFYVKMDQPDEDGSEYIQVNYAEDSDEFVNILKELPEQDLKLLAKPIGDMQYGFNLKIFPKCPHCQNQMTNTLILDDLVFRKAQNMSVEIQ